ncbi:hypothetical protein GCM10027446_01340 [Angustibacter peucedani]
MAGGPSGFPRRAGPTLAERTALTRQQAAPRRHCWVDGPADSPGPWPGLVVEWRKEGEVWVARTVYVVTERKAPPVLVEQWLSSDRVRAAD